jgi:hypothetical protein
VRGEDFLRKRRGEKGREAFVEYPDSCNVFSINREMDTEWEIYFSPASMSSHQSVCSPIRFLGPLLATDVETTR